jgi:hypothetical protein
VSDDRDDVHRPRPGQYAHFIELDGGSPCWKAAAYAAVLAWQNALYENTDDFGPTSSLSLWKRPSSRRLDG